MTGFLNKYRIILLAGLCVINFSQKTWAQGIQFFEGNWDQLKAEAKKQHKPFFIDCYTSWCGPCKAMASKIFPQKSVGDFYNANYISYSIDMEKGEGPSLSGLFNVKVYPTFIYFSPEGEMMHRTAGGVPAEMFIEQGKTAIDPQKNLVGLIKSFNGGKRDTTFLLELVETARYADDNVMDRALDAYWKAVPVAERSSGTNWERFKALDNNVNSFQYNYVRASKDAFIQKYGEEEVNKTLFEKAAYSGDP
jgi:thiol-disulfide isomerase/thioredoxin